MVKRLDTLKGLRKSIPNDQLDPSRYEFLSLDQAEPNPGSPDSDNSLLASSADGTRKFTRELNLNALSFKNDQLPNYDNVVVDGTYALILNNDPNSHNGNDSVGYRQLTSAAFSPPTLQTVTEEGNTTDQGIDITDNQAVGQPAGLTISATNSLVVTGTSNFTGQDADVTIQGGALFQYKNAPAVTDNTILTIGDNDSVGTREALFAFVAPTFNQVVQRSITANDLGSTGAVGGLSSYGIGVEFLNLRDVPKSRASTDERTALVFTNADDSVGSRELRDFAVADSTNNPITVNSTFTTNNLYVKTPTAATIPSSGTIPLVVWNSSTSGSLITSQTQADFDGTGNNGTFTGGDGAGGTQYFANDSVTLSDGSRVGIVAVDGNGDVTQFTILAAANYINHSVSDTVTQASVRLANGQTGSGIAFSLTLGSANIDVSDDEYAVLDVDVENLDANFETLQSVTARQEPGLDVGETTNEAIFSGELRLRNDIVTDPTTSRLVLIGEPVGGKNDSAVVRRREATYLAFGDSTDALITTHGLLSKQDITVNGKGIFDSVNATVEGEFALARVNNLTAGRVVFSSGNKRLTDDADLTFSGDTLTGTNITVTGQLNVTGTTLLDSVSIDAGAAGKGITVTNIGSSTTAFSAILESDGTLLTRTLVASAFENPGLDDVTAIDPVTTDSVTVGGLHVKKGGFAVDSAALFKDSVQVLGDVFYSNPTASTSLRVLVRHPTGRIGYQDLTQEAVSGETLHTATSQGRTTDNGIGVKSLSIWDLSSFSDNDDLDTNFTKVIDSERNFLVQDKIFFNDNHAANPIKDPDRNFIRFTDPAFKGYPGIFDFVSDDSDDASSVGNSLLRAGGLILTDSAFVAGNLTITGNLNVTGTTTTINSTQLTVAEKTIVIADSAQTHTQAAGAGIYVADSTLPFASFIYDGLGSWVIDRNLKIDSALSVTGSTLLNGDFSSDSGGVTITGLTGFSNPEFTALVQGPNDSVGIAELSSGAFTNIDDVTWEFVLGKGRTTGNKKPYIQSGFQVDSEGLPLAQGQRTIMVLNKGSSVDSVAKSVIETTAYEPLSNFSLQFVSDRGTVTSRRITVADLNLTAPKDFDASANNTQLALFWTNGTDSVGYRDLGNLAFLDSDGETFKSITEKGNRNNVTSKDIQVHGLRIDSARSMPGISVGMMYKSSTDSVGIRQLSDAAFLDPGLTEVLQTNDSTRLKATVGGGLILPLYGTASPSNPNVTVPSNPDFFQMLIINDDTDSVARGNIGTIVQTVSTETLQTVTARGAALNSSSWDSTSVGVDLSGGLKLKNLTEFAGDSVLIANSTTGRVYYRKLSEVLASQTLHNVTENGPTTDNDIGANSLWIYNGTGFTNGDGVTTNHTEVIDSDRNAYFVNLDATGLTTLDSTTVDGTLLINTPVNQTALTIVGDSGVNILLNKNISGNVNRWQVGVSSLDGGTPAYTNRDSNEFFFIQDLDNAIAGYWPFVIEKQTEGLIDYDWIKLGVTTKVANPGYIEIGYNPNTGYALNVQGVSSLDSVEIIGKLDVTGLTTLDSTTIDGTLTVNDSARVNEILTVTSSSDYPIRSVSTGRFAGIEFTDIFGTARFVYDGNTSKFDTLSTSLDVGGDLDVAGLTTLDSTTVDTEMVIKGTGPLNDSGDALLILRANNEGITASGINQGINSTAFARNRLVFEDTRSVPSGSAMLGMIEWRANDAVAPLDGINSVATIAVSSSGNNGGARMKFYVDDASDGTDDIAPNANSFELANTGAFFLGTASDVTIEGTAVSTSSTTGALMVAGGVGVGGNIYADGNLTIDGITTLDSTAIDAGAGGNGLTIPNLGEVTTNTDILTINGDVVSKTAFSDIYTVPPTPTLQSVTDAGNITDNFIRIRSTTSGGNVYLEVLDSGSNPDLGYHLVAGATSFQQFETNEAGSSILNASTVIEAEDSDKTTMAIIRHGDTVGGPSLILAKNRGTNKLNKSAVSDNDNLGRIIFGGASNTTSTEEADPYTPSFEISADVSAPVAYNDLASTMRWFSHDGGTKTQVMSLDNIGNLDVAQSGVFGTNVFINNAQATNVAASYFGTTNDPIQGYVAVTHNTAGGGTSSMSLAVSNTGSGVERVEISPTKMQLKSSVQLQDAAGTNLVIYDSAGAVLWGNV